jgi:hypothetical protein
MAFDIFSANQYIDENELAREKESNAHYIYILLIKQCLPISFFESPNTSLSWEYSDLLLYDSSSLRRQLLLSFKSSL